MNLKKKDKKTGKRSGQTVVAEESNILFTQSSHSFLDLIAFIGLELFRIVTINGLTISYTQKSPW